MISSDVKIQLALLLPQLTDKLTTNYDLVSLTRSGTVMTAKTKEPHGLQPGNAVAITGAVAQITGAVTRAAAVGTIVTDSDHDLTEDIAPTITLSGAAEAEFNGTFVVMHIKNRRTIEFVMVDSGPTTATGSPILEDAESPLREYNTTYVVVETPTDSTFTFEQTDTTLLDPVGTIQARALPRIASAIDVERAIAAYTKQDINDLWLFAILDDVVASKSRRNISDIVSDQTSGNFFRQQIIQGVTLYLFVPASSMVTAAAAKDTATQMLRPLCQSILWHKFDTGLATQFKGQIQFVGNFAHSYDGSLYVHGFSFQQMADLYREDCVVPSIDVAFRGLAANSQTEVEGTSSASLKLTADIDLDDTPL